MAAAMRLREVKTRIRRIGVWSAVASFYLTGDQSRGEDVARQPLMAVPLQQVTIKDDFWSPKLKLWQEVTVRDCFAKFANEGTFENFNRVRAGEKGGHNGPPWYDGLVYEMIRASSDFLISHPDPALKQQVAGYIEQISDAAAVNTNGYIETWTELMAPNHEWGLNGGNDVEQHELYNAGALIDAGVHWYRATGQTDLLKVAVKMANIMCGQFGPAPKINQVPGHELGEEALINLYRLFQKQPELKAQMPAAVNETNYLELAEFWIDNRGKHQGRTLDWGSYAQDDLPVDQQQEMEGHAVRDCLLCSGLTAAGNLTDREDYLGDAQRLWNNMVNCKMYITGGVGAVPSYEGFGPDYYLPNDTAYNEICAAVAAGFFSQNMSLTFGDARHADILERELFNGILVGVSQEGTNYYYDNPLEIRTKHERWVWNPCPCCPPMFLKIMADLPSYIYAQGRDEQGAEAIYINQFIGSEANIVLGDLPVNLQQTTHYPWNGDSQITVMPGKAAEFTIGVRLPGWCTQPEISVNGEVVQNPDVQRGYARLYRTWQRGDVIRISLPMPVRRIKANLQVQADIGRVAFQRGPVVYCLEGVDNGRRVSDLVVPPDAALKATWNPALLGGVEVVTGRVIKYVAQLNPGTAPFYSPKTQMSAGKPVSFTAIPYYAQNNRTSGELEVWVAEDAGQAKPGLPSGLETQAGVSASHCWQEDTTSAVNDGINPQSSDDSQVPRFTWWDHHGTDEWIQYNFKETGKLSRADVYWWDERRTKANCRVPLSWRLLFLDEGEWKPVQAQGEYGTNMDVFNEVSFAPVETTALRLEVQLQPGWSGGILQWMVH
jgi:DUF1680 family protein